MLLKWILKNKYKLMAFIIGLYVIADIVLHKGMARVLLPESFPVHKINNDLPKNNNTLINQGKEWLKAVNTKELMDAADKQSSGIECDVYFNRQKEIFDVHHDIKSSTGLDLKELLDEYSRRDLKAGIWLDLKNLNDSNYLPAVAVLVELRSRYKLTNKLLVESGRADLLKEFSINGFYTSYYTPVFNPYKLNDTEVKQWVDSISSVVEQSEVNALSGYYFQYPFFHHYFPNYPILIWSANDRFSLVNWLFKKKIAASNEVFIALYQ